MRADTQATGREALSSRMSFGDVCDYLGFTSPEEAGRGQDHCVERFLVVGTTMGFPANVLVLELKWLRPWKGWIKTLKHEGDM